MITSQAASNMNLDPADLQPTDKAIENAKALLSSVKCGPKENLYEQMVSLLKHLLKFKSECGPSNMDHFTNLVQFSHIEQKDRVKEFKEKADEVFFAEIFQTIYNEVISERLIHTPFKSKEPDLIHLNHILNNAETGFSTDESILLSMHFQKLLNKYPSEHIRFWGKIFGFKRSYYIAEAQDFQAWPVGDENSDVLQTSKTKSRNELIDMLDFDENGFPIEGPPKPLWKPTPTVPVEAPGQGANKHAYFVLSEFGSDWELLPAVEPEQIKCARKIRLFFTGDLDATIISYPPFPGKERHLLRAQIARITAATLISPMNFYRFDEEEEESDDEEVHHEHFVENEEYEPLTVAELADPSVTNWVHHAPYLLPQGRTKWINVVQKDESDSEDSEASSKAEEIDLPEPETGPPLLTPIAEDQDPSGIPPWSAKLTSSRLPQFAMAVLSSNLWPGAYAIGFEQSFLNFYIGWGQKYIISNFEPALHPDVMEEFPSGPETMEMEDPTADEEEAWKAAHAELGGGSKEDSGSNSDEGNDEGDDWADEDA